MTAAVWVYKRSKKTDESLYWSIESAARHLRGISEFVVVGDRPPATSVPVRWLSCPQVSDGELRRRFGIGTKSPRLVDTAYKLLRVSEKSWLTDRFVRMYDDQFFLRSVQVEKLDPMPALMPGQRFSEPSSATGNENKNGKYRDFLKRTADKLRSLGKSTYSYAYHGVPVFEKSKIAATIEAVDLFRDPVEITTCYFNWWQTDPPKPIDLEVFRWYAGDSKIEERLPAIAAIHNTKLIKERKSIFSIVQSQLRSWLEKVESCPHRGPQIAERINRICSSRSELVPVFECSHFGQPCTIKHYQSGQKEAVCRSCELHVD